MADFRVRDRAFVCRGKPKATFGQELIHQMRQAKWSAPTPPAPVSPPPARPTAPPEPVSAAPAPGHTHKATETRYTPPCATNHPLPATPSGHHTEVYAPPPPKQIDKIATERECEHHLTMLRGRTGMNKYRTRLKARLRKLQAAAGIKRRTPKRDLTPGKDRP